MNEQIKAVLEGTSNGCIVCGDCLEIMAEMPDGCVDMCVTSPPYWGLRDYGVDGQLGLEQTPEEYVAKMVEVFAEVKRVLADHGTLWLNLGDSYYAGGWECQRRNVVGSGSMNPEDRKSGKYAPGLKPKDLCGIPWRVAFALQADGWYLRSDIIWYKPNPMPEPCRDRPTKSHEYLFLLTKRPRYFYDAEAIKEETDGGSGWGRQRQKGEDTWKYGRAAGGTGIDNHNGVGGTAGQAGTRNKRSVWTIATEAMSEAHFATYPQKLVEPCILAGTSAKGYCPQCGKPWVRVVERTATNHISRTDRQVATGGAITGGVGKNFPDVTSTTTGWQPTCKCGIEDTRPGIVLEPFGGSGTTGVVAGRLKRNYVLIDLNHDYVEEIAKPRLDAIEHAVPVKEAKAGQLPLFVEKETSA